MGDWRNKRMRDDRREMSKLEPRTVALIRVATAIAKGDEAQLRERMTVARAAQVPAEWMEELLLQSLHNVGYPLTLMAFGVWRELAGPWPRPARTSRTIIGRSGKSAGQSC